MHEWRLSFIREDEFLEHVAHTIRQYDRKLQSYDLEYFNRNIIDPIKLLFDRMVYSASWEQIIHNEIFRQRDKASNNDIGYFHQHLFRYVARCRVPENGEEGGWDIIVEDVDGIPMPDGQRVQRIYVEMKNKHNTMNSASSSRTFSRMQHQLLKDDSCACFLVEAIAKHSQNIVWAHSVDGQRMDHKLIRRVSLDVFYEMVTGEPDAFFQVCMALPDAVGRVLEEKHLHIPQDTVYQEIRALGEAYSMDEHIGIATAFYLMAFSDYPSFSQLRKD